MLLSCKLKTNAALQRPEKNNFLSVYYYERWVEIMKGKVGLWVYTGGSTDRHHLQVGGQGSFLLIKQGWFSILNKSASVHQTHLSQVMCSIAPNTPIRPVVGSDQNVVSTFTQGGREQQNLAFSDLRHLSNTHILQTQNHIQTYKNLEKHSRGLLW